MASFGELQKQFNKDFGKNIAVAGNEILDVPRIPFGVFPLDLATGGGLPEGRIIEIFGIPGCCKSNLTYMAVGSMQRLHAERKNALIDFEKTFMPAWARKFGLVPEDLLVISPDYAEQSVDMIEALISSPECGLVMLDSMAAMVTLRESENSADKADPGGSAMVGKKLVNKVTKAQRAAEREGRTPTLVIINQLKFKIGVMYGDPATVPGGESPKFGSSLRLRLYAKDIKEEKWSTTHPARKEIRVQIIKNKVPIVAKECIFEMAMIPHAGMQIGEVDDWKTLWHYLNLHGLVTEDKKGWLMGGKTYSTQKAIREYFKEFPEEGDSIKAGIIQVEVAKAYEEEHKGKKE